MDFLDPKKKRAQAIRLAIGHTLMGLLVLIGTYILVYQAYGFDIDRKTGQVFQNGLVFIDSAPDGAEIKINGQVQREQTNTRLALPEGRYSLEINKQGYRKWRKTFSLEGGKIERFVYPTLFLSELQPTALQNFDQPVSFVAQSPDRRRVLIGQKNSLTAWTEYDLNTLENNQPTQNILELPNGLFTVAAGNHTFKLIEWSADNKNLLVRHTFRGGSEFVLINRDQPAESFNVNKLFEQDPDEVRLRDKKSDQLYFYFADERTLRRVNVERQQSTIVASRVLDFEPQGSDVLALTVMSPLDAGKMQFQMIDDKQTFLIREVPFSDASKLAIAQYDGEWYFAAYDPSEKRIYIYKNPADFVQSQPGLLPAPVMVLSTPAELNMLSFSQNSQFIVARSGQHFSVYDNEYARSFGYQIKQLFSKGSEVIWMDGHRLLANSNDKVLVFEFDGQNQQILVGVSPSLPPVFNRDYTTLYTLTNSKDGKKASFNQTFLRLEEDR